MDATPSTAQPTTRMTPSEMHAKALERAQAERLQAIRITDGSRYLVRSRFSAPGSHHLLEVVDGRVVRCDCLGWHYRQVCAHAAAVRRRLTREAKRPRPAPKPWQDATAPRCRRCGQVVRLVAEGECAPCTNDLLCGEVA